MQLADQDSFLGAVAQSRVFPIDGRTDAVALNPPVAKIGHISSTGAHSRQHFDADALDFPRDSPCCVLGGNSGAVSPALVAR